MRNPLVAALFSIVFLLAIYGLFANVSSSPFLSDFRAFYCAGAIAGDDRDPYLQEPLYSCESERTEAFLWRAENGIATPAPVPPYVLTLLEIIARVPFAYAAAIWVLLLFISYVTALMTLRTLTGLPYTLLLACLIPAALISLPLGQLAPVAIAFTTLSGLMLRLNKPKVAGLLAVGGLMEPHIAIASCVAVFMVSPRSRSAILTGLLVIVALALIQGVGRNAEYFGAVLPAHASSEVSHVGQYSVTLMFHVLGATDHVALALGAVQYALTCSLGVAVALLLAKKENDVALAATIPMAFAVFGGSYVHLQQLGAAMPGALMFAARRMTITLGACLVLLAVPWLFTVAWDFFIPLMATVAATIVWYCFGRNLSYAAATATLALCFLFVAHHALIEPHHTSTQLEILTQPSALAENSWSQYVKARITARPGPFLWAHFPTWIGLGILVLTALLRIRRDRPVTSLPDVCGSAERNSDALVDTAFCQRTT